MAKKALLVGVNKYKYVRPLNGCVNDIRNMADILTNFYDFSSGEIRTLVDESVTRNNLIDRLDWLLDGVEDGDLLLFHFSGHGSQIQDRNGDELDDDMDEILCLYDMDFRNPDSYLTDDDFNNIIDRLPKGIFLTACIDSCHSGTATRDIELLTTELQLPRAETKIQPRFIEPPADIAMRSYSKSVNVRRMGSKIKEDKKSAGLENTAEAKHVLLAGCTDDQTSADAYINNDYAGAFTYNLCKTIRDTRGLITYQELIKRVQNSLAFNSFSQIPQLNGNKDLKNARFLSSSIKNDLTCEHGHPLTCKEGHPPKGYVIPEEPGKKSDKKEYSKRIHISTKYTKCAISPDIILPSDSEFVGTIRDITDVANKKSQNGSRDSLGNAYNPKCIDFLEDIRESAHEEDFRITNVLEFCPNEQRAFGGGESVKPIQLSIRCKKDDDAVLLSFEDGVWSWHFRQNTDSRDIITNYTSEDRYIINSFNVPFKIQDRTTRGIWSKVVYVFKFATGGSSAITNILKEYEGRKIREGFKLIEHSKGFTEGLTSANPITGWNDIKNLSRDKKKALLFIHGTGSSLEGGYGDVPVEILEALKDIYPVVLGYDHFTLSKTPEDNAKEMLQTLKASGIMDGGLKFDVITHSRGGLVLRSLVELCNGYPYIDKATLVACPAAGTSLANTKKWDSIANMLNLLTNIFFFTGGAYLKIFFRIVGGLVKFLSKKIKEQAIPGVSAMDPTQDFIKKLNQNSTGISGTITYNIIGSDFEPSGIFHGGIKDDIADCTADAFFGHRNDLIVDTDNMYVTWPKGIKSGGNFIYDPQEHVYHLNYFKQAKTYLKLSEFFNVNMEQAIRECVSKNKLT
jgi:hypothetical protein